MASSLDWRVKMLSQVAAPNQPPDSTPYLVAGYIAIFALLFLFLLFLHGKQRKLRDQAKALSESG